MSNSSPNLQDPVEPVQDRLLTRPPFYALTSPAHQVLPRLRWLLTLFVAILLGLTKLYSWLSGNPAWQTLLRDWLIESVLVGLVVQLAFRLAARLQIEWAAEARRLAAQSRVASAATKTLEMGMLLELLVESALDVVGLDAGAIYLWDQGTATLGLTESRGLPDGMHPTTRSYRSGEGITGQAFASGRGRFITDLSAEPALVSELRAADVRAQASLPLRAHSTEIGVLNLYARRPHTFGTDDVRWLESIAELAAAAVYNVQLHEESRRQTAELQAVYQMGLQIGSGLDPQELLPRIVATAVDGLPAADRGLLLLLNPQHNELIVRASYGFRSDVLELKWPRTQGNAWQAVESEQTQIVSAALPKAHVSNQPAGNAPEIAAARSSIVVPLAVKGRVIGALALDNCSSAAAFDASDARLLEVFASQAAITVENAQLYEDISRLAATDGLTGLFNRRSFIKALEREFARSARHKEPLAGLLIDVDELKRANDTYGHLCGDALLVSLALLLRSNLRQSDLAVRYGGDEFAVLLPNTDRAGLERVAEKLLAVVRETEYECDNRLLEMSVSIGGAVTNGLDETPDEFIRRTDNALYRAKAQRNSVVLV